MSRIQPHPALVCCLLTGLCSWARAETPAAAPADLNEAFVDPMAGLTAEKPETSPADLALDALQLRFGGRLQTDVRVRPDEKSIGDNFATRQVLPRGFTRNENIFKVKLDAIYGDYAGVVDVDLVWTGFANEVQEFSDLSRRERIAPYRFEAHALYLEAIDVGLDGLDLRIGQQLVQWGKADQFNPTNSLNADDVEDKLLFGQQIANLMARLDYSPSGAWQLSGVLVPIFKPSLVPPSASLGLGAVDRMPILEPGLRQRILVEQGYAALAGVPTRVEDVHLILPENSLENMQWSVRLAGTLLEQDWALSYYQGRDDYPQPILNRVTSADGMCDPKAPADCVQGLLLNEVSLIYPKVRVLGFNLAGEIPLDWIVRSLGGLGYRLEVGVFWPEQVSFRIQQEELSIGTLVQPAGEYDYGLDGRQPLVIDDQPFAKWTLGLDYTLGSHVMANLMWVHGLSDEFGAGDFLHPGNTVRQAGISTSDSGELLTCIVTDQLTGRQTCGRRYATEIQRPRLGDYVVFGLDIKFDDDRALLRLFTIWDISGYYRDFWDENTGRRERKYLDLFDEGACWVVFPEFNYNFGNGFELGLGALLQLGENYTKFGDPAAGGSLIFTRARFSY